MNEKKWRFTWNLETWYIGIHNKCKQNNFFEAECVKLNFTHFWYLAHNSALAKFISTRCRKIMFNTRVPKFFLISGGYIILAWKPLPSLGANFCAACIGNNYVDTSDFSLRNWSLNSKSFFSFSWLSLILSKFNNR